jgi:hypothetical protein
MRMEWGNLRGLLENGVEVLRGYQGARGFLW